MTNSSDHRKNEYGLGEPAETQITQEEFIAFALLSMEDASLSSGDAKEKWLIFSGQLYSRCAGAGDLIPKRFVQVCDPSVLGSDVWWWEGYNERLNFFETGSDKFRYLARVF